MQASSMLSSAVVRQTSSRISPLLSACTYAHFSTTKRLDSLSDEDKQRVRDLIASSPTAGLGYTSILTGRGISNNFKQHQSSAQRTMIARLSKQFPSIWDRAKFVALNIKHTLKHSIRINKARQDLSPFLKGRALENKLVEFSVQGMVMAKVLIDMYGTEKASEMIGNAQKECIPVLLEPLMTYLENEVPHHLRYAVVNGISKKLMTLSAEGEGLFDIDFIHDDIFSSKFEFHVKRCVFRDLGHSIGDQDIETENNATQQWYCSYDEKILSALSEAGEVQLKRKGTLAQACSHCDFKFTHKPKAHDVQESESEQSNQTESEEQASQ